MRQLLFILPKMLQSAFMNIMQKAKKTPEIEIVIDSEEYDAQFEILCANSFGPGRFAKAASLLRENNRCEYQFSRAIMSNEGTKERLIGACRIWPIIDDAGNSALFLGPIVVDEKYQGQGFGALLVEAVLAAIKGANAGAIILVGDLPFFGRFGFEKVPHGHLVLPASVNQERLLWRDFEGAKIAKEIRPLGSKQ